MVLWYSKYVQTNLLDFPHNSSIFNLFGWEIWKLWKMKIWKQNLEILGEHYAHHCSKHSVLHNYAPLWKFGVATRRATHVFYHIWFKFVLSLDSERAICATCCICFKIGVISWSRISYMRIMSYIFPTFTLHSILLICTTKTA